MEKIEFSRWLFEGRLRQGKNLLPDGLNWLCYFAGNSKSHRENSISVIFLESPHQVDMKMKNIVKSSNDFFEYFNTLETQWFTKYVSMLKRNVYSNSLDIPQTLINGLPIIFGYHYLHYEWNAWSCLAIWITVKCCCPLINQVCKMDFG